MSDGTRCISGKCSQFDVMWSHHKAVARLILESNHILPPVQQDQHIEIWAPQNIFCKGIRNTGFKEKKRRSTSTFRGAQTDQLKFPVYNGQLGR